MTHIAGDTSRVTQAAALMDTHDTQNAGHQLPPKPRELLPSDCCGQGCDTHDTQNAGHQLPPKPREPLPSDCCGQGCTPCVFDLYDQEVALWTAECERIECGGSDVADLSQDILSADKYRQFKLTKVEEMTLDSLLYTFDIPGYQRLPIALGQHLVLRWQTKEKSITRQYTPITQPHTKGRMEFVIKLYTNGEMSQYIRTWKVGDLVDWRGPFGNFSYTPNSYERLVFLAAGSGITPMVQVIQHILDDEDDETWLHLVYCCTDHSATLCKDLIRDWVCFWNFSVMYFLNNDPSKQASDRTTYSRLTEDYVRTQVASDVGRTYFLVCGTKSFEKDIINYLRNAGVKDEQYFKF